MFKKMSVWFDNDISQQIDIDVVVRAYEIINIL
jgi:hypothetical protein